MTIRPFPISALIFIMVVIYYTPTFGQTAPIRETMQLDLQFGGRIIHRAPLPNGPDIDFLNYLHGGTGNSSYGVVSVGFSLSPNEDWTFSTTFSLFSDVTPNNFQIGASHNFQSINPLWEWGVRALFYAYPQYIDEYNQYHLQTDTGVVGDLDKNYRQRTLYDFGISAIPYLKYNSQKLNATLGTGLGLNAFKPFEELITQKKPNANFRREIRYATGFNPTLTSHTWLEATYDIYHKGSVSIGIIAKAEFLWTFRNLPYTRTIVTWTEDNIDGSEVRPENKFYSKTDISGGVFFRF